MYHSGDIDYHVGNTRFLECRRSNNVSALRRMRAHTHTGSRRTKGGINMCTHTSTVLRPCLMAPAVALESMPSGLVIGCANGPLLSLKHCYLHCVVVVCCFYLFVVFFSECRVADPQLDMFCPYEVCEFLSTNLNLNGRFKAFKSWYYQSSAAWCPAAGRLLVRETTRVPQPGMKRTN